MRTALIALKYQNRRYLAEKLIDCCAGYWPVEQWGIDRIIPIPNTKRSERKRGYNQALLLAEAYAQYSRIPYSNKVLIKNEDVKTQVGLSAHERKQNIKNAFQANSCLDLTLLLIDDVCTTGATMESAAHALKEAGAREVYGATIARTIGIKA
jgi:competence protein ComFC